MKIRYGVAGLLVMLFSCLLSINEAYGSGYLLLTGGSGGEVDAGSIGGEIGWIGQNFLLGVGISIALTEGDWERKSYYYYERYDNEYEGYGVLGIGARNLFFTCYRWLFPADCYR